MGVSITKTLIINDPYTIKFRLTTVNRGSLWLVGPKDQDDFHRGNSWVIQSWEFVVRRRWWHVRNSLPETLNHAIACMAKHHAKILETQLILNVTTEAAKGLKNVDFIHRGPTMVQLHNFDIQGLDK